ncbi:hypothetical protein [Arthrobacter agilis]|uniref:hypothetical protein n=1 Tax=Arthrobacter agilis TaxID=37921 RepID=UPI002783E3FE|nr:hypothetical protein [Arthrobacter agilis]MDQ0735319.1 hypothetical protein [Arthrobacter agilis]
MTLDAAVADYVRRGYAVESRTNTQAVMAKKRRIGWFWNILLSIVTGGLWLIVVIVRLINRKVDRVVLNADPTGMLIR